MKRVFLRTIIFQFIFSYSIIATGQSIGSAGNLLSVSATDKKIWSIGVMMGSSPFNLASPEDFRNPVLTPKDINDIFADVIAHPFVIKTRSSFYMYFTAKDKTTDKGGIGLAKSNDGTKWLYMGIVLKDSFALSYPNVFKWKNEFYMTPEANKDSIVRLYRAVKFPDQWECIAKILKGDSFISPTVFRFNKTWWMFTSPLGNETLRLFYSEDLTGPWIEHPKSPVVERNKDIARPAGRPVIIDGVLYRLGMDCLPVYGNQVHAFQVTRITRTDYAEEMIHTPIVKASSAGWNSTAMHHMDALRLARKKWIGFVDASGE